MKRINIDFVVTFYVYTPMVKENKNYMPFGKNRNPSKKNLLNVTHITTKPSYAYVFYLYAQRNYSLILKKLLKTG